MTVAALASACVEVALAFRLGADAEASDGMLAVLDGLERALGDGTLSPSAAEPVLAEMLAAQERGDLLLVADILEQIIAPSLEDASAS